MTIAPTGLLFAALLMPSLARAQEPARPEDAPRASAAVSVGYVVIPFTVSDAKGRPVRGLDHKSVAVLVDGRPIDVDLFAENQDAAVSFAILLDVSGSMGLADKMAGARAAIHSLVESGRPGDDYSLHVFARGAVEELVPFTTDGAKLLAAAEKVEAWGRTALYDAIVRMPDRSLMGKNGTRAILLFTDGLDNSSKLSQGELVRILEGIDVPVYPIGLRTGLALATPAPGTTNEALLDLDVLGHIARSSGGRIGIATDPGQLAPIVADVLKDLRSQYVVGFTPSGEGRVKYHPITLRLSGSSKAVRVRAGYRGTDPPYRKSGKKS